MTRELILDALIAADYVLDESSRIQVVAFDGKPYFKFTAKGDEHEIIDATLDNHRWKITYRLKGTDATRNRELMRAT